MGSPRERGRDARRAGIRQPEHEPEGARSRVTVPAIESRATPSPTKGDHVEFHGQKKVRDRPIRGFLAWTLPLAALIQYTTRVWQLLVRVEKSELTDVRRRERLFSLVVPGLAETRCRFRARTDDQALQIEIALCGEEGLADDFTKP